VAADDEALGPPDLIDRLIVRNPAVAYSDLTLREMVNLMAEHGVTRTPVVERESPDRLVGMVTLVDALRARRIDLEEERVSERVFRVRQLVPLPGGASPPRASGQSSATEPGAGFRSRRSRSRLGPAATGRRDGYAFAQAVNAARKSAGPRSGWPSVRAASSRSKRLVSAVTEP
jgi:CBS domain-containing protein